MAGLPSADSFFFADHLVLDNSPTRKYLEVLVKGIVHKQNNMLGVAQGFSDLLLLNDNLDSLARDNIQQIKNAALNSSEINQVLPTLAGCAVISADAVDLGAFLPNVERKTRELCEGGGVTVQFNVAPGLSRIRADAGRLSELLDRLIKNAVEAAKTASGGAVMIDVRPSQAQPGGIDFIIRNNGAAADPGDLSVLFVPFKGSKGPQNEGVGLTAAAILAGQMSMRLGIHSAGGVFTAWLCAPGA